MPRDKKMALRTPAHAIRDEARGARSFNGHLMHSRW
jgi:hypothetical protein